MAEVMSFDPARRTSAQAILDLVTLGYLNDEQLTLDATYGKGRFWKKWRPSVMVENDLDPERGTVRHDYRNLPDDWTNRFDVVVFDPPFKLNGTGGSHPSDEAYGVANPYRSLAAIEDDIYDGLSECLRVTRPRGLLLYKCQDQVSGGKRRWFTKNCDLGFGVDIDADLVDELYIYGYRQQPEGRPQKHSRMNVSVLQVYRRL